MSAIFVTMSWPGPTLNWLIYGSLFFFFSGAGDLPAADTLRKTYLPKVREQEEAALKEIVKGKQVSILCDETTDRKGQCVFLVLIKLLECSAQSQLYVGGVKILSNANATECARAIVEVINKLEIPFQQITSVVTDSARYMTKCVDSLKVLFGDSLIHVQCWAHKMNLVSSIFQVELKELNNCVLNVKNAFLNTRKRKHLYQAFLKEKYEDGGEKDIKLFPSPVITRWNSWHKSVVYIHTYLPDLHEFFSRMEEGGGAVQALRSLTDAEVAVIQCQANYVVEHCSAIVTLLEILEGSYPYSHKLQSKLQDVENSLKIVSEGCFGDETSAQLKAVPKKHAAALTTTLANAAAKANVKLAQLQNGDTAKSFLRAIGQMFDERLMGSVTIEQVKHASKNLPLMSSLPTQVVLEGHAALKAAITTAVYAGRKFDLLQELLSLKEDHENFVDASVKSLWVPVSNVDSERGFSAYTNILTDRRTTLSPANVELMLSLTFGD